MELIAGVAALVIRRRRRKARKTPWAGSRQALVEQAEIELLAIVATWCEAGKALPCGERR